MYNLEQLIQDRDMADLYEIYGLRGVKFAIDYYWSGSPYQALTKQDRLYEAYYNALDWFPDEKKFILKDESKQLDILHQECIINYDLIKRCGEKSNRIFKVQDLEVYNSYVEKEREYMSVLSSINIMDSINEKRMEEAGVNIELSNKASRSLREISKLRKESELAISERLSETKIASLNDFL